MIKLCDYAFWFIVGSQDLYGEETLEQVAGHARIMAEKMNESKLLPCKILLKPIAITPEQIHTVMRDAGMDDHCAGVITWMHIFSPSKMWIGGLASLTKPYCHLHTQFSRHIPNEIDMNFMNLNQSAHGDREHGFIGARMRIARKIIVGFWQDQDVMQKLADWMRSAVGAIISKELKVMRFGDNMREVAVTEGDKVEAQIKLGWQINTFPVGDLVEVMDKVSEDEVDAVIAAYKDKYDIECADIKPVRYQAKEEIAIRKMLDTHGCMAFTNTFQDLHGMEQLPGLATQSLMEKGYGYGGEGDWKVAAMTAIMKAMAEGMKGGTSFMEDYTYDLGHNNEYSLGAHMLEVCPTLSAGRARIEVHSLGIGNRNPPARLVFEGHPGSAIAASLVDMGGRFRLIVQDVEAITPILDMPSLPVARVMWRGLPDFKTGCECWLLAGGAHHTVFSYDITAQMMADWADIMGIEYIHIGANTTVKDFRNQLFLADLAWKLR